MTPLPMNRLLFMGEGVFLFISFFSEPIVEESAEESAKLAEVSASDSKS